MRVVVADTGPLHYLLLVGQIEGEACGLGTNINLREGDLGAGGLELGRHMLAALAVPIAECHARALGDETPHRRLADHLHGRRPAGGLTADLERLMRFLT